MSLILHPNMVEAGWPSEYGDYEYPDGGQEFTKQVVAGVYAGYVGHSYGDGSHEQGPKDAEKYRPDYVRLGRFHVLTVTEVGL